MNTRRVKISLLGATALFSGVVSAQKGNEVNAAMEFQSFQRSLMSQDYEAAKKAILDSKKYIDEAAVNPETKDRAKTLFYKGQVYLMIPALASMMPEDSQMKAMVNDSMLNQGVESLKRAYKLDEKNEYRDQITNFAEMGRVQAINGGIEKYKAQDYKSALEMFEASAAMYDIVGKTDSLAIYNAGLAAENQGDKETALKYYKKSAEIGYNSPNSDVLASSLLRQFKRYDEAKELVANGLKKFPGDKGLILEQVNIDLNKGDNAAAEKSLSDAIAADPNNKQLYFAIGSIYDQIGQAEKAENSFKKAISLDSNYQDAIYSLGAHFVNLGAGIKEKADALPFGDAGYDALVKQADAEYTKAIPYLEHAARIEPNNAEVLNTLYQLYRKVGNTDKAMEYKKRYDALGQ